MANTSIFRVLGCCITPAAIAAVAPAEPLTIDLTVKARAATQTPIGPGTTTNRQGQVITADSRSLFLDGVPWIPVCGEFPGPACCRCLAATRTASEVASPKATERNSY